jgi:tRNA dimethylallyltransferase
MIDRPIVPVVLGPTASGKTSVGIELAKLMDGEIISVDSRKVYKGIPIGTATPAGKWKDNAYWVDGIAHHLMDFLALDRPYTAGDFVRDATMRLQQIVKRGRTPILVGGTGFYFKALSQGLPALPAANLEFRHSIEQRMSVEGVAALHTELARIDPPCAARITKLDRHKIIRALEIFHLTGIPMSSFEKQKQPLVSYRFITMGLDIAKDKLERRIEKRSAEMEKEGMLDETETALKAGYAPDCAALNSFGYREATQVALGQLPRDQFLPLLIKGTKAYAKRQRTWFRTQTQPSWFRYDEKSLPSEIAVIMKSFCYTSTNK